MVSMSSGGWQISGIKEIEFVFDNFQKKEAQKIIKRAMKTELTPLANEIRANFPKDTGKTAKQIKPRMKTRKGVIIVDISSKDDNFIPKFIEFGTVDHGGNQTSKPSAIGKILSDFFGTTDHAGNWRIKPHHTYTNVFKHRGEQAKKAMIARILHDAQDALNPFND